MEATRAKVGFFLLLPCETDVCEGRQGAAGEIFHPPLVGRSQKDISQS